MGRCSASQNLNGFLLQVFHICFKGLVLLILYANIAVTVNIIKQWLTLYSVFIASSTIISLLSLLWLTKSNFISEQAALPSFHTFKKYLLFPLFLFVKCPSHLPQQMLTVCLHYLGCVSRSRSSIQNASGGLVVWAFLKDPSHSPSSQTSAPASCFPRRAILLASCVFFPLLKVAGKKNPRWQRIVWE